MTARIPDSIELFNSNLGEGKYLGSPVVVDEIIRETLGTVNAMRIRQADGETINTANEIGDLCRGFQEIFYGQVKGYTPSVWHRPSGVGQCLVTYCHIGGTSADAVYRMATRMVKEYVSAYSKFERDEMEDMEFDIEIQRIAEFYTKILVGSSI